GSILNTYGSGGVTTLLVCPDGDNVYYLDGNTVHRLDGFGGNTALDASAASIAMAGDGQGYEVNTVGNVIRYTSSNSIAVRTNNDIRSLVTSLNGQVYLLGTTGSGGHVYSFSAGSSGGTMNLLDSGPAASLSVSSNGGLLDLKSNG